MGYDRYVDLVRPLLAGKEVYTSGMTKELERSKYALDEARKGRVVSIVSSGDAGIYGMAGLVLELDAKETGKPSVEIKVVPGVPAFVSAAAILGSPLMHDFASISLSDILTPWETIEKRLRLSAEADFVISLYNPRSSKRQAGYLLALDIIGAHRKNTTPAGIVRNATRNDETVILTEFGSLRERLDIVDMLSIVIIGNSCSYVAKGRFITPRGYTLT